MGDECLEVGGCRQAGAAWEGVEVRDGGWGMGERAGREVSSGINGWMNGWLTLIK